MFSSSFLLGEVLFVVNGLYFIARDCSRIDCSCCSMASVKAMTKVEYVMQSREDRVYLRRHRVVPIMNRRVPYMC